jgi:hypothetical protein
MNYDAFSKSNPVADAYLAMLAEADAKNYPFKKKAQDGDEKKDDKKKSDGDDSAAGDDAKKDDKSKKSDDSSDKEEKDDDAPEGEEEKDDDQPPKSEDDQDQDGDEDEVDDKDAAANQAAVDTNGQVNPERPEWIPDTVADADLSTFINAVAAALEQDKTQFSWGGRYFLIQRKTEADLSAELDPNQDPKGDDQQNPNDPKKKQQQNFGESTKEVIDNILKEAAVGKGDDGYAVVARHAWDLSKKAHAGGSADDHHLAAHIHKHAVHIQSMRYGGGDQQKHHQEIAKHHKALGINEGVELTENHDPEIAKHHDQLKAKDTKTIHGIHKQIQGRVVGNYTAAEVGGKSGMISDILRHHHGDKKVAAHFGLKEATELAEAAYHTHSHVLKKIKDGEWEAQSDVKVGHHVEVIDHTDGKKRKMIHVEKDPLKENVNDVQTQKILDMHKKIAKVVERPDEQKQDGADKTPKADPVTHK